MNLEFKSETWRKLACERHYTAGLPAAVVTAYRMRVQALRAARRVQVLLALEGWLHLKKLQDSGQHSIRVTNEWELLVEFRDGDDECVAVIDAMVQLQEKTTKEHRL